MAFLLTPPAKTHPSRVPTFTPPPLDGSLTVSEIYDFHYEKNPWHPVFVFAAAPQQLTSLTYSDVVPAAHRAARFVAKLMNLNIESNSEEAARPLVAIVATSGMFITNQAAGILIMVNRHDHFYDHHIRFTSSRDSNLSNLTSKFSRGNCSPHQEIATVTHPCQHGRSNSKSCRKRARSASRYDRAHRPSDAHL